MTLLEFTNIQGDIIWYHLCLLRINDMSLWYENQVNVLFVTLLLTIFLFLVCILTICLSPSVCAWQCAHMCIGVVVYMCVYVCACMHSLCAYKVYANADFVGMNPEDCLALFYFACNLGISYMLPSWNSYYYYCCCYTTKDAGL